MRLVNISVCLLLLCACNSEPSAPPPPAAAPAPATARGEVVFMGDSITSNWPLDRYLSNAINVGISSQTSEMMRVRFKTDVLDRHPTVVVILAGTNDILRTGNPSTQNIAAMADLAQQAGAKVIIGTVPPNEAWLKSDMITDRVQGGAEIRLYNRELKNLAAGSGYKVADYYAAFVLPSGEQNADLFKNDHQHPNLAGYDAMWAVVRPLLRDYELLSMMNP